VRYLQLDEDEGNPVDEQHHVGASPVHLAGNPELRDCQPVVGIDAIPVDVADSDRLTHPVWAFDVDLEAVAQKPVDSLVCPHPIHRRPALE
jgi:hypothetical protein